MDILGKLFGSKDIIKILRLFLLNAQESYDIEDVTTRTRVSAAVARQELLMLASIGFVKKRSFYKEVAQKRGKNATTRKKRVSGFILDDTFAYLEPVRNLIAGPEMITQKDLLKRLGRAGSLKLVVLAGVFVEDFDSRLDVLLVGDRIRRRLLENAMRDIETEIGREVRYAAFSTDDFLYRLGLRDRLVRDAFDYPHATVVDRLGIEQK